MEGAEFGPSAKNLKRDRNLDQNRLAGIRETDHPAIIFYVGRWLDCFVGVTCSWWTDFMGQGEGPPAR